MKAAQRVPILSALVLVLGLHGAAAWAKVPSDWSALFTRHFYSHYEARKCGQNISALLDAARELGLPTQSAQIVTIDNPGTSVFGMVNAELARGQGAFVPGTDPRRFKAGETNWYFHVVLQYGCDVLDLDFTNEPQILPMREYLERMFLTEKTREQGGDFFVGRERKLTEYKVERMSAADYFKRSEKQPKAETLQQLLQSCE